MRGVEARLSPQTGVLLRRFWEKLNEEEEEGEEEEEEGGRTAGKLSNVSLKWSHHIYSPNVQMQRD